VEPGAKDDEVLLAYRMAYIDAQSKVQEKADAHDVPADTQLHVTMAVLIGIEVECTHGEGCGRGYL
jgi:hypothetical protein